MTENIEFRLNSKDLDTDLVDQIKVKLEKERNFPVVNYTDSFFRRRILVSMGRLKIKDFSQFIVSINESNENLDVLIKELSINVTQFFRNPSLWKYLEEELFPEILKQKSKDNKDLRIWVAGTATGQEPYSIAIILDILTKNLKKKIQIDIRGIDLSEKALKYLKEGLYIETELEGVPDAVKTQYFTYTDKNHEGYRRYKIHDDIMKMVTVNQMDLFSGNFPKKIDVIFCRNVVIYFNRKHKRILFEKFINSLKTGGYLIIGMSETMPLEFKESIHMENLKQRIYQKKGKIKKNGIMKPKKEKIAGNRSKVEFLEFIEIENLDSRNDMIEGNGVSKFDPYQKKIVDLFCRLINKNNVIKDSILRGFIIRSFREWREENDATTKEFLKLPPRKQYDAMDETFEILKSKLKRIRRGKKYEEVRKGIDSANKYYKKYLNLK